MSIAGLEHCEWSADNVVDTILEHFDSAVNVLPLEFGGDDIEIARSTFRLTLHSTNIGIYKL